MKNTDNEEKGNGAIDVMNALKKRLKAMRIIIILLIILLVCTNVVWLSMI